MLKILSVDQIRAADAYTIANEPIKSIDLMERAARACAEWIQEMNTSNRMFEFYCGTGNNGGDGLAVARMLSEKGITCHVNVVRFSEKASDDFTVNYHRLKDIGIVPVTEIYPGDDFPAIDSRAVVVDALLGSGLAKPASGFVADCIRHINQSGAVTIAIDLPSGMFADALPDKHDVVVQADYTLSFQLPKLSFFFPESEKYTGRWIILPIGLMESFIQSAPGKYFYVEEADIRDVLRPRNRHAHKGHFGHALLMAGSYGKMGAAILASKACLRAGAGLLTTFVPKCGYQIMQTAVPETMVMTGDNTTHIDLLPDLSPFTCTAAGPGIGTHDQTANALKILIQSVRTPLILDADAINILALNPTWLSFLPNGSILTPHPGEFDRLAGKKSNSLDRNKLQIELSVKYGIYIVLKGAFTCISTPKGNAFFNSTGNPGMATAGSGDVLTGILAGLLAQGYTPFETCLLGVYLHGLAGDLAASSLSQFSLMAGDITDRLGDAFLRIQGIEVRKKE